MLYPTTIPPLLFLIPQSTLYPAQRLALVDQSSHPSLIAFFPSFRPPAGSVDPGVRFMSPIRPATLLTIPYLPNIHVPHTHTAYLNLIVGDVRPVYGFHMWRHLQNPKTL